MTRILCATASHLHRPRPELLPPLVPLTQWFNPLLVAAPAHDRFWSHCSRTAHELLASPRDVTVLHGDIHHGNVLNFGELGWLAIDPKVLYGEEHSTMPTSFATRTVKANWRGTTSVAASNSSQKLLALNVSDFCNGYSHGRAYRQPGCSKMAAMAI